MIQVRLARSRGEQDRTEMMWIVLCCFKDTKGPSLIVLFVIWLNEPADHHRDGNVVLEAG
jgi:hypothetical protein